VAPALGSGRGDAANRRRLLQAGRWTKRPAGSANSQGGGSASPLKPWHVRACGRPGRALHRADCAMLGNACAEQADEPAVDDTASRRASACLARRAALGSLHRVIQWVGRIARGCAGGSQSDPRLRWRVGRSVISRKQSLPTRQARPSGAAESSGPASARAGAVGARRRTAGAGCARRTGAVGVRQAPVHRVSCRPSILLGKHGKYWQERGC